MTAILGVVLYEESISPLQITGCLLVLVAGLGRVLVKTDA
jgi:drug/metabolite transporter (DMT)-like permease